MLLFITYISIIKTSLENDEGILTACQIILRYSIPKEREREWDREREGEGEREKERVRLNKSW